MEQVLTTLVFVGGLAGLSIAIYFTLSFYFGDRSVFLIRFAKACSTDHGVSCGSCYAESESTPQSR